MHPMEQPLPSGKDNQTPDEPPFSKQTAYRNSFGTVLFGTRITEPPMDSSVTNADAEKLSRRTSVMEGMASGQAGATLS